MRDCTSLTKKGLPCKYKVEPWRIADKCHIHDPNGVFRQQVKNKVHRGKPSKASVCDHTFYMRHAGITCTKCGLIWEANVS